MDTCIIDKVQAPKWICKGDYQTKDTYWDYQKFRVSSDKIKKQKERTDMERFDFNKAVKELLADKKIGANTLFLKRSRIFFISCYLLSFATFY